MFSAQRIHVMGASGSGKTTFARRLAARLGLPHTELDAIHWRPDWQMPPLEEFRAWVAEVAAGDAGVVDGNYGKARDLVWARVELVVFLDYPLWLSFGRLLRRSLQRALGREPLWAGNRESLRQTRFSRDSILLYTLRTYRRRRWSFYAASRDPHYAHIRFLAFRWPRQAEEWLDGLADS